MPNSDTEAPTEEVNRVKRFFKKYFMQGESTLQYFLTFMLTNPEFDRNFDQIWIDLNVCLIRSNIT